MLAYLTDFASSRRGKWITLLAWVIVSGLLISQLPSLSQVRENDQAFFLPKDSEATRAYELARDRFPSTGTPVLVVFRAESGLGPAAYGAATDLARWLSGPDAPANVGRVRFPEQGSGAQGGLVSKDGTTMYVFVDVTGSAAEEAFADTVNEIRDRTAALGLPGVEVAVGGAGGLLVDLIGVFSQIDTLLLLVTVLLVLVLLLLIYRSPIMAALPLLAVGTVFMLANAVGGGLAQQLDLAVSAQTTGIMTVVLFGTGTDYVLFVSARFREELTRHQDRHEAMRQTMRGVGGAVASAGATILIASVVLLLATLRSYQALGPVIGVAVALMMLAAITLVPAVLTIVGRAAFWPARPQPSTGTEEAAPWRNSIYGRIGAVVLRRPLATLAVTGVVLSLLIVGLTPFQTNYDSLASLPKDTESVRSFELLREGFPTGELAPTLVYISLPPGEGALDPKSLQRIDTITVDLSEHPGVARVAGPSRPWGVDGPPGSELLEEEVSRFISEDGGTVVIHAVLTVNPFSLDGLNTIPELRTLARESAAAAGLPAGSVLVGGDTAQEQDTRTANTRDTFVVLPLILLAIGVVLAILLRSLIAPLYLMATIAFTYFSTLGLAVLVFVVAMGHPGVGQGVPFFLFVFLNALSVDYNIYLMSRIREEVRGAPLTEAAGHALARTGPVITSAGMILAGTFSALMVLPLQDLMQLGFAVAAGVLIDTFITRTLIVPALVALFGRWNWWPSRAAARRV